MDRSQLVELRNKFSRLDEILNSFQREPRPLEDFDTWRERFQALFMQLATINKFPGLTKSLVVSPLPNQLDDSSTSYFESILRTRPDTTTSNNEEVIAEEVIRKRADILLANLTSQAKMEINAKEYSELSEAPEELIEALKLFY